jgi:predicted DNA-binding protein (MmcQ/YjbR family)
MKVDEIRNYCLAFPDTTENLQWGDDLCFKVRGKIFVTLALTAVPQKLCFKCTAETFTELLEREDIRPAPYVGRYKWVILDRMDALRADELQEFIRQSYEMVVAKVAGKDRSPSMGGKKKATKKKSAAPHERRKRR